jgi:hypothetical protein
VNATHIRLTKSGQPKPNVGVTGLIAAAMETLVIVEPDAVVVQSMVALPLTPVVSRLEEFSELGGEDARAFVTESVPGAVTACVHPAGGKAPSSKSRH